MEKYTMLLFPACGQTTVRIVGGQDASENQLPWQCTLYRFISTLYLYIYTISTYLRRSSGNWYGCGATIISCDPLIVISAAHCFQVRFWYFVRSK